MRKSHIGRMALSIALLVLCSVLSSGRAFGQGGTGREPGNANKAAAPATKSRGSRSTSSTAKESDQSTATLEETMNWIGGRLATPSLFGTNSITVGKGWIAYTPYTKDVPGSPSYKIDGCTITVERTYTLVQIENEGGRNKLVIPFSDIDPGSIKRYEMTSGYGVSMRAVRPTIRLSDSFDVKPSDNVDASDVNASFEFLLLEDAKSFEKAVRHAVKLCGGKPSKF